MNTKIKVENHPCFNKEAKGTCGRIHLPVAPRCNIQCNYCNRKYDCVNESRPGVTCSVLSPKQALSYLDYVVQRNSEIKVVGIAGPGDPMANPEETLETFRLIREKYPEMLLCLSTNGLNLEPYIDDLVALNVSHVTVTVNALDPKIGEKVYAWIRYGKRVLKASEGVPLLIEKQMESIRRLKAADILVKVNTIILPGINDHHIPEIAKKMAEMNVDILNCIPLFPSKGTQFEDMKQPGCFEIEEIRSQAAEYLPQMRHCSRCRADAVGLLGKKMEQQDFEVLKKFEKMAIEEAVMPMKNVKERPYVAVATLEGMLVNQHLGEAQLLQIYEFDKDHASVIEQRLTPKAGGGAERWRELAGILHDCRTLVVNGIGENPKQILSDAGLEIIVVEGMIEEVVIGIFKGEDLKHLIKRSKTVCGLSCSGTGGGCT